MTCDVPATPDEAQALHDQRRRDPEHDQISCWCCCLHCDFDAIDAKGNGQDRAIQDPG